MYSNGPHVLRTEDEQRLARMDRQLVAGSFREPSNIADAFAEYRRLARIIGAACPRCIVAFSTGSSFRMVANGDNPEECLKEAAEWARQFPGAAVVMVDADTMTIAEMRRPFPPATGQSKQAPF